MKHTNILKNKMIKYLEQTGSSYWQIYSETDIFPQILRRFAQENTNMNYENGMKLRVFLHNKEKQRNDTVSTNEA